MGRLPAVKGLRPRSGARSAPLTAGADEYIRSSVAASAATDSRKEFPVLFGESKKNGRRLPGGRNELKKRFCYFVQQTGLPQHEPVQQDASFAADPMVDRVRTARTASPNRVFRI